MTKHRHADFAVDIGLHGLTMEGRTKNVIMWCEKCGAYAVVSVHAKRSPPNGERWYEPNPYDQSAEATQKLPGDSPETRVK